MRLVYLRIGDGGFPIKNILDGGFFLQKKYGRETFSAHGEDAECLAHVAETEISKLLVSGTHCRTGRCFLPAVACLCNMLTIHK